MSNRAGQIKKIYSDERCACVSFSICGFDCTACLCVCAKCISSLDVELCTNAFKTLTSIRWAFAVMAILFVAIVGWAHFVKPNQAKYTVKINVDTFGTSKSASEYVRVTIFDWKKSARNDIAIKTLETSSVFFDVCFCVERKKTIQFWINVLVRWHWPMYTRTFPNHKKGKPFNKHHHISNTQILEQSVSSILNLDIRFAAPFYQATQMMRTINL